MLVAPEDIMITEVKVLPKQLSVSFEYLNSSITVKYAEYSLVDKQLYIRLSGGLIFPWNDIQNCVTFEIDANDYDSVYITTSNGPFLIWHNDTGE